MSEHRLSDIEFQLLRRLVYTQTGITLGIRKKALLQARLSGRLRELGMASFLSYYRYLRTASNQQEELQHLVNRVATNTTALFREPVHFDFLAELLLPAWRRQVARSSAPRLRLWSAGCSTGQEAYSLAAVLHSFLGEGARSDAKILATDVSSRALAVAKAARYSDSLAVVPPRWRGSFLSVRSGEQRYLTVAPAARARVSFRLLNLLTERLPFRGRFDVIFCRNVLIYFDEPTQQAVLARLAEQLTPGGCLVLGLAEGLTQLPPGLLALGQSIYQNTGADTGLRTERPDGHLDSQLLGRARQKGVTGDE
jgi:chemotaxis protein methyltransferase CheR